MFQAVIDVQWGRLHDLLLQIRIQIKHRGICQRPDASTQTMERIAPVAKIIFSLPLPTDIKFEAEVLYNFRWRIYDWMHDKDPAGKYLFINFNPNMIDRGLQRPGLYANDGVHLLSSGKGVMMRSFRGFIHTLVKRYFKRR